MPAVLLLVALAAADRAGAQSAVFYLFLAGIPLTGAAALAAYGRLVDASTGSRAARSERAQAVLAGVLVALFVLGAAAGSPAALAPAVPGLADAALVLSCAVLALQALVALVPVVRG
ncbi:MAG: hypothetical protein ICV74_08990 [Thermoleophilia bacterium]|nr:hypothetical protein [Thermoleophilia bacterium]